jgi:hypothetical protein
LPVWPIWAAYGYQPASTTARVAATALLPPKALASASTSSKPSALPRPRPPATEHVGALDVHVGAALLAALDHRRLLGLGRELHLDVLDGRRAGAALLGLEGVQAADDDPDVRAEVDLRDGRVAEDRALGDELVALGRAPR